jgi:hypothetical protein
LRENGIGRACAAGQGQRGDQGNEKRQCNKETGRAHLRPNSQKEAGADNLGQNNHFDRDFHAIAAFLMADK